MDWSALAELEDVTDLEVAAAELLEEEAFETSGQFDALGRPVSQRSPDGTLLRYGYNEAALLESVTGRVRGGNEETTFVSNVDYNARGQRTLVAYGNGTQTAYTYDPQTFRLERLRTQGGGQTYQDLRYWFDAAGNIVEQQDGAQQSTYFGNAVVEPGQQFAYDAQSRLGWASGREHRSLSQPTHESFGSVAHREDGSAMRRYTQRYVYDVVGNILRMQHAADGGDWTRRYVYEEDGNRLVANSGPEDPADQHSHTYGYDVHGNMTSMPHLSEVQWDFADRMQSADLGGGGTAYFVYDAGGERVRKVRVNEGGGRSFERIYVGGFEVYRERVGGTVRLERESVHVGDDAGRMCLLETRTVRDGAAVDTPPTVQRYQYGNHLGSAALELTEDREVISYEEYHPYGTSSYRAANSGVDASERRYRYTGKERDEETGLGYHGARYYACWLGRWTASDPIGLGDGVNRYAYVSGNPVSLSDPSGPRADGPNGQVGDVTGGTEWIADPGSKLVVEGPAGVTLADQVIVFDDDPVEAANDLLAIPGGGPKDFVAQGRRNKQQADAAIGAIVESRARSSRVVGAGVQVVGGVLEIGVGMVGAVAPEPATTAGGVALIGLGVDQVTAGLATLGTGSPQETVLHEGTRRGLEGAGVSAENASTAASVVEFGVHAAAGHAASGGKVRLPERSSQAKFNKAAASVDDAPAAVGSGAGTGTPAAGGSGRAAVDTNALIGVAEEGQAAAAEAGLAGRSPVVPLRAAREFLGKPATRTERSSFLRQFLGERDGGIDIANAASEAEAAALQARVAAVPVPGGGTRVLKGADAAIGASADKAGLELLSFDKRFVAAFKSVGGRASRLVNR